MRDARTQVYDFWLCNSLKNSLAAGVRLAPFSYTIWISRFNGYPWIGRAFTNPDRISSSTAVGDRIATPRFVDLQVEIRLTILDFAL